MMWVCQGFICRVTHKNGLFGRFIKQYFLDKQEVRGSIKMRRDLISMQNGVARQSTCSSTLIQHVNHLPQTTKVAAVKPEEHTWQVRGLIDVVARCLCRHNLTPA